MSELVWFFGASGAGKASIIQAVADGQFVIPGVQQPIICKESLQLSPQERGPLLKKLAMRYGQATCPVLVKGQSVDVSEYRIPYELHDHYPEIKQKVVFVYTQPDSLAKRVAHRRDAYWPNPNHDFVEETNFQIQEVHAL